MSITWRRLTSSSFTFWIIGLLASLYYLYPLIVPNSPIKPLKFGIDLVGGTYISLIVDTDRAVEDSLFDRLQAIKSELKQAGIEAPKADIQNKEITLTFPDYATAVEALSKMRVAELGLKQQQSNNVVKLVFNNAEEKRIKHWAVESNIRVLENRLNKFAVSEITVAQQGEKNIIIELPNVDDPAKAKAMIGKAAILEFKLVEAEGSSEQDILDKYDGELPEGTIIIPGKGKAGYGEREYYLVQKFSEITGKLLRDAFPDFGQYGRIAVGFQFTPEGGKKFYELTSKNIRKPLAIVLDNEVISAPRIDAGIKDRGQITSDHFTSETAKELADLLKSGAYVAPVKFDEERTVGPSLGAQAIKQGTLACLVGLLLLFIFSILYYKIPGLFAFITLLYNLILILVILGYFRGTLTLPGIAGLVLTLGMAIDSSILIYEKIKEELRHGVTLQKAIEAGFSGALVVILDANITTFIMGVVLFYFGTGPVQGFAITLMVGIITTLITGLFFLRSMFNFATKTLGVQTLKF